MPYSGRKIPVIGDYAVDRELGTGAMKISPGQSTRSLAARCWRIVRSDSLCIGHDAVDFEMAERHGLEYLNVLNKDGTINQVPHYSTTNTTLSAHYSLTVSSLFA